MPHLVAFLITRVVGGIAHLVLVVDDISDRAKKYPLTGFAIVDMLFLGFAEAAGQRQMRVIVQVLTGKTEERVSVDSFLDFFGNLTGEIIGEVDTGDTGAEVLMKRFTCQLGHWKSRLF